MQSATTGQVADTRKSSVLQSEAIGDKAAEPTRLVENGGPMAASPLTQTLIAQFLQVQAAAGAK